MSREAKDILQLLVMILPLFLGMLFFWFCSPMYQDVKGQQKMAAREYLARTYFHPDISDREYLLKKYGFTDDDLNPSKILAQFKAMTHCNQNPGGLR